ncbi:MAG: hypothetical protein HZC43_00395 [Nitrosomonadales bacterium]|nr:hypothetical protein [Nitrosomonadales bacterium]
MTAIVIPKSGWETRNDTAHLLGSPENAKRLMSAKKQAETEIARRKQKTVI